MTPSVPDDVTDRLLWRDAYAVLTRHQSASARTPNHRTCRQCHASWPCQPYQLARYAERAAHRARPRTPRHRAAGEAPAADKATATGAPAASLATAGLPSVALPTTGSRRW